jgi:hypothetical protein
MLLHTPLCLFTVERPLALSPAVTDTQLSMLGAASLRGNPRFRMLYLHGWKQSATKFKNLTKQLRRKLEPLAGESASSNWECHFYHSA